MKYYVITLTGALVIAFFVSGSAAAGEGTPLTYDELLEGALTKSPTIQAIASEAEINRAEGIALTTLPNPTLTGEVRPYLGERDGRDTEYAIGITQPLRIRTRSARARVAELIESTTSIERKIQLQEFEQGLLLAYGKGWAIQEKLRFSRAAYERAQRLANIVRRSAQEGVAPASTEKLFAAESRRLQLEAKALEGDLRRVFAELTRRSGIPSAGRHLQPLPLHHLSSPAATVTTQNSSTEIPLVKRIRLRNELAREQHRLARLDSYPELSPFIGWEHTDDGNNRLNIGITMPLPFTDRNQADQARTSARTHLEDAQLRYLSSGGLDEELRLLQEAANISAQQATSFRDELLPAIESALRASEDELAKGQGSPFQVWQVLLQVTATQDRYLELWTKALSERVEFAILLGADRFAAEGDL